MRLRISDLAKIYFCTGARNHDLLKILPQDRIDFEYDERMASFKALGLAKGSGKPVAVCTTSGTAVSECVSALLEARYSEVPLVLISGDRPKKMHGTGAPQTVEHELLTVGARGSYFEIPLSEFAHFEIEDPEYPVHINVLVDDTESHELKLKLGADIKDFCSFLSQLKRPLFLFSHESESMRPFVERFLKTGHAFYAEAMSGARNLSTYKTEKDLVKLFRERAFDGVVRVGHTPLSKVWRFLEQRPVPVFSFDSRGLPGLSFGNVMKFSSSKLLSEEKFWMALETVTPSEGASSDLITLLDKFPQSEPAILKSLQIALPKNAMVYLGNSLIIRFFELVQDSPFRIIGNRGVNGIDGQLATAIGLAASTQETVYCVLGDITTRYDLSSIQEMPKNLKLIIVNNRGGRIFDMLGLDKRIVLEHEKEFSTIVPAMGVTYSTKLQDLPTHQVIELCPSQKETESFLAEWM